MKMMMSHWWKTTVTERTWNQVMHLTKWDPCLLNPSNGFKMHWIKLIFVGTKKYNVKQVISGWQCVTSLWKARLGTCMLPLIGVSNLAAYRKLHRPVLFAVKHIILQIINY